MYIFLEINQLENKAKEANKNQMNQGNSMHIQYSYAEGQPV